ncbi:MAG: NADH-quinone oxidoreductase subunit H [Deltaproteobacteria bacterium]|nr:NADH-quinone oxidoreductase subunit H [Deltaproteobacteria bacterium]
MDALEHVLQVVLLLALPPLLLGIINKVKARFGGRRGPPLLQLYYDLAKLLRKGSVTSRTTTWVFVAGPAVTLVTVVFAGLLVPIGPADAPLHFAGDFVLLAYLLGLSRFFTASAALDTGSAFEGMGAARDVTFACFAEVTLFFSFLAVGALSRASSLSPMLGPLAPEVAVIATAPLVLVVAAMAIVLLAETARVPVDDPNTHLELTMIHEVMVLDHGGPALGVILYGASVKLFILAALIVRLVLPEVDPRALGWLLFLGLVVVVAVAIGVIESVMARLRMRSVPALLVASCLLAGFGFLLVVT